MADAEYKMARAKFLKAFANIPEMVREDIVAVVDEKPYTWNTAMIEIKTNTETGRKIIKLLKHLGVIT